VYSYYTVVICNSSNKRNNTMNQMWRTFRILLGSLFYLLASLVLIISLKCYPKDLRKQAKDSFV